MRLPNADHAFVDVEKLRGYCLSLKHPRGRNKARMFASLLGLTAGQSSRLRGEILKAVITEEAKVGTKDVYGQRYTVDFSMDGITKRMAIRTAWIVRNGEDFPRLTSCYIL
jgi:hypothetical protein